MHIAIVGPGRLGRTMAHLLTEAGHQVELYGPGQTIPSRPVTWLTVPDRAISEAAAATPSGGIVLHASGATDIEPLRPHQPAGSLHPLMTFPGPEVAIPNLSGVGAAIAGDPRAQKAATEIAHALSMSPFAMTGDRRLYHAAAVMAGNFTTALLAEAAEALRHCGASPDQARALLAPLAQASIANAVLHGPQRTLTGPVARGDEATIAGHTAAIEDICPELIETYSAMLGATRRLIE